MPYFMLSGANGNVLPTLGMIGMLNGEAPIILRGSCS